jgi:hypothetical protein
MSMSAAIYSFLYNTNSVSPVLCNIQIDHTGTIMVCKTGQEIILNNLNCFRLKQTKSSAHIFSKTNVWMEKYLKNNKSLKFV